MLKKIKVILGLGLLAGLAVFYFSDIIFSDKVFAFRDLSRYYYPLRYFAFSQIREGNFPFWNPYINSGHSLFATLQSCVLYPVSVIYLIFNFDFAFNLFIILHIFLGGAFFYLLMRDLKFEHISALISGIVFMFSGYLVAVINLTTTLSAAVWFPLVFLFYNRALIEKRCLFNVILSSVFLGFMFLGGEPTPMVATVMILGFYTFARVLVKKDSWKALIKLAAVLIIFVLLFSFQIIPFLELVKLSNRAQADFALATYWSFPPRDVLNFIMPFFYGSLQFQEDAALRQDWLLFSYLGIIPVMLFIIGFIYRKDKYSLFFRYVFILGLIFIYGRFTPVYQLLYNYLPGFGLIRYPVKFFFLSTVAFAFLAGCGWQEFAERVKGNDKKFVRFIYGIFVCAFIAAFAFLLIYLHRARIFGLAESILKAMDAQSREKYTAIFNVDLFNFRRLLVFFILGGLFLFLGAKRKIKLGIVGAVLSGLIFLDLYGGRNIEFNPAVSRAVLHKETGNVAILKKDKSLFRVYTSSKMNKFNESLRGDIYEQAFESSIDNLCPNRLMEFAIYDARGYLSIHNANYSNVMNIPDTAPLPSSTNILNMLNVKYILTLQEIQDPDCLLINETKEAFLYENLKSLPRAYLVPEYLVLKKEADIANKLRSKDFKPERQVILEEEPYPNTKTQEHKDTGAQRHKVVKQEKEYVEIIEYKPNYVTIRANIVGKPKFLVLADNHYPGWKVFVDGNKGKIYKADFVLRGVYLAPGEHSVRFVFDPASFKIGLGISLLTAFILLILLFVVK